ncbi:Ribosomal RNA small subunit methyltransferase H [Candidatus Karelsulcia muelleri]|uniref:16S rRNA (cytosine(1402)-N(4))-methyltransferase RsmH n=1 Tax=Candidatus Karelsulcia muelleri TaxID=336810 RepID=UPI001FF5E918|nr:16S rRNA (cytosine(1402)-N(4))-methyltransferase RsmH [Candidatus Karelsulcia muelleri]UOQ38228.1 Ribosomal RNA small subunit methyltransferase H [Candidatus Karelsulcia muelleri]
MKYFHIPVLLSEVLENLIKDINGIYIDTTFGSGGHSFGILKKISNQGKLFAFDQDQFAIIKNKICDKRIRFFNENFRNIQKILKAYKNNILKNVSGIIADLGVSSYQIDTPQRGFSIRFNKILDMRMDLSKQKSALNIIKNYSFEKLNKIFNKYGEFKNPQRISRKIVLNSKFINTTLDLVNLFKRNNNRKFLSRLFQALRIEVNDEINALKKLLKQSINILKPGGRLAIISYHSLEDRLVKNFFKSGNIQGIIKYDKKGKNLSPFNKKYTKRIFPTKEEITKNNRARSAILRITQKKVC